MSNPNEILGKWLPHEAIIFQKFHEDWTKIVDSLLIASFWTCADFFYSDLIFFSSAAGGALRSLSEMGAMLTMLTTGVKPGTTNTNRNNTTNESKKSPKKEDNLGMEV